jgi:hypothetical protein
MSPESGSDDDNDEEDAVGVDVRGGNVAAPPAAIINPSYPVDNPLVVVPPPPPAAAARGFGLTPRPSIGKKRAKQLAQQAAATIKMKKTKKDDPPEPDKVFSFNLVLKHRQNESLDRLAFAAEAKANVAKEQYLFNFHMKSLRLLLRLLGLRQRSSSMPLLFQRQRQQLVPAVTMMLIQQRILLMTPTTTRKVTLMRMAFLSQQAVM